MNAIEKIIETLENYVEPSQLDDARAELAALREVEDVAKRSLTVAEAAKDERAAHRATLFIVDKLTNALAKLASVKGGQK